MTRFGSAGRHHAMWRCRRCGRRFANRGQTHSCARHTVAHHFAGKPPRIRGVYRTFLQVLRECGRVAVVPQKSRIAFQVRMAFAQLTPRKQWVDGHLVLGRRVPAGCVRRIDSLSPGSHVHHFRLRQPEDITSELRALVSEAYAVGEQRRGLTVSPSRLNST